jgi:hypothetical protein
MTSEKQVAANRLNAQKSTGPKDTSRTRFNRIKHGLRCTFRLLPDENPEEFFDRLFMMIDDYDAQGPIEYDLVTRIVQSQWLQDRALREEAAICEESATVEERDTRLLRISRYRLDAENTMFRCMKQIRIFQKERGKGQRVPLPKEAFLPALVHESEEAFQAFLQEPPPQMPELPTEETRKLAGIICQVKLAMLRPEFNPENWPAEAVRKADLELALGDFPARYKDLAA